MSPFVFQTTHSIFIHFLKEKLITQFDLFCSSASIQYSDVCMYVQGEVKLPKATSHLLYKQENKLWQAG
jgi:hypothetical protein